jgi:hypothetical protein
MSIGSLSNAAKRAVQGVESIVKIIREQSNRKHVKKRGCIAHARDDNAGVFGHTSTSRN